MSFQIFLQGKILGSGTFLVEGSTAEGRACWTSLLSEVLPRALLAELGLSAMLLGSSGADQFLILLPAETLPRAEEFCREVNAHVLERSNGGVRIVWAWTENLGDWSDIRKRLHTALQDAIGSPLATVPEIDFRPFHPVVDEDYFTTLAARLQNASAVGWSPERPADVLADAGKYTWRIGGDADSIPFARHSAPADDEASPADAVTLASRAVGRPVWGVLRGDVDNFGIRLHRAQNVEEHLQLSVMYKQFFVSELHMLCSLPDYWRKLTLIQAGGDDFAVYGAWDALLGLAREVQRIFSIFVETNLKEYAGLEGKTISMSIALARNGLATLETVLAEAAAKLEIAKSSGKDCIYLFGRTLEWKQFSDAADTRHTMTRLIKEFGCPPQLLFELAGFYTEAEQANLGLLGGRGRHDRVDRPWRFHRRLNTLMPPSRNREFLRLRTDLINDFTGRRAKQIRLRPQGRVALEWARLETQDAVTHTNDRI
jgi:CRISPR-associated protein Csm1